MAKKSKYINSQSNAQNRPAHTPDLSSNENIKKKAKLLVPSAPRAPLVQKTVGGRGGVLPVLNFLLISRFHFIVKQRKKQNLFFEPSS